MGMDLIPRNDIEGFHANWSGWGRIQVLLEYLGCNLKNLDGSNDGRLVPKRHARAWGRAVQKALKGGLVVARIRSAMYEEGERHFLIPVSKKDEFKESVKRIEAGGPPTDLVGVYLAMDLHFGRKDGKKYSQLDLWEKKPKESRFLGFKDLDPTWTAYIGEFAEFCIKSGGFEQC